MIDNAMLRPPAEVRYADELAYLASRDPHKRPPGWRLSPQMVRIFVLGSSPADGLDRTIAAKWIGSSTIMDMALATLIAGDRGLLLIGAPGTGKSWLAELLAAAISGVSTLTIAGTAGTSEEALRYNFKIPEVLAHGYTRAAIVPSPIMTAMQQGLLARVEELTRVPADVQDTLLTTLSERMMPIPEVPGDEGVFAVPGFNVIATANDRDKGVNELSSALKRRFNFITIPVQTDRARERQIIQLRTGDLARRLQQDAVLAPSLLEVLLDAFAALRQRNADGTSEDKRLDAALSTADAIAVVNDAVAFGSYLGDAGGATAHMLGRSLVASLARRPQDAQLLSEFWSSFIAKQRDQSSHETQALWAGLFDGGREALDTLR